MTGYRFVLNQDRDRRDDWAEKLLSLYRDIDGFLLEHSPEGPYLFDEFGLSGTVFTPMFKRFWFLDYYEGFQLPEGVGYDRVRVWREACMAHEATEQVSREEIVKLYYDYAHGAGNGALLDGWSVSSFIFTPPWQDRPWPPRDKYSGAASDEALGLVA